MKKNVRLLSFLFLVVLSGIFTLSITNKINARKNKESNVKKSHYEAVLNKTTFTDQRGVKYTAKELKKGFLVINFWASWCTPCLEEFPSLVLLDKKIDDSDFKIIGINSDDTHVKKNIKKTLKKFKIKFPIIEDPSGRLTDLYKISAIPVSLIFYNGKLIEESQGAKDFDSEEFLETINKYLK